MAGTTGLEPAASAVTGQRSNQLNYVPTPLRKALLDKAAGFAGSAQNAAHKMRSRRNRPKPLQVSVRLSKLILTQGIANEREWALICGAKCLHLPQRLELLPPACRNIRATRKLAPIRHREPELATRCSPCDAPGY